MNGDTIGWIRLHRKLSGKSFYRKDSEKVHLWIHLLFCANRKEREEQLGGKPITCKPGQFTTGRKQLAMETGISESKIERILTYFEKIEQQIEQQKTSVNRLISICNWSEYQTNEQQTEQQVNNDRTTSEQRVNTLQEYKETKEDKEDKKNKPDKPVAKYDFIDSIISEFASEYEFQRDLQYSIINKGKERMAGAKLLTKFKERFPEYNSEQIIKEMRVYFKLCIGIKDGWLWNNMSLPMMINKFNEINNILRNGSKTNKSNNGASLEQIRASSAAIFPDK